MIYFKVFPAQFPNSITKAFLNLALFRVSPKKIQLKAKLFFSVIFVFQQQAGPPEKSLSQQSPNQVRSIHSNFWHCAVDKLSLHFATSGGGVDVSKPEKIC